MKIVHITRTFLEGFGYQDNELAEMHSSLGHDVAVIAGNGGKDVLYFDSSLTKVGHSTNDFFKVLRLPVNKKINFRFWKLKGLIFELEKLEPDLIFFHGSPMFSLFDVAKYKKKHPQVKVVLDCHNDFNNAAHGFISKEIMHKLIYRNILHMCDKYIDLYYYLSPNIKVFMQEMYKINDYKLSFLPRGGILENMKLDKHDEIKCLIRTQLGIKEDDIVVVSGGKLDKKKLTHNLCKAINQINNPKVHLILFGSIEKSYEKELLESIDGNSNIHIIGWVSSIEVYDYYHAADFACFPGGHSVLWEQAICCGLPILVQNWYGGMWYLNVKENALLMKDGSIDEIISKMDMLLSDNKYLKQMSTNAKNEGCTFFSYKRIANQILSDVGLI